MSQVKGGRSLISKYRKGRRVSVSDLVGPLWCEHKQYYDLVGLKRKGIRKRPLEFEVKRKVVIKETVEPREQPAKEVTVPTKPEGATLPHQGPTADEVKTVVAAEVIQKEKVVEKKVTVRVSKPIAQRAERNSVRGREIHKALKDEVHPEHPLVNLRPGNLEERDAKRVAELILGLLNLKERGIWRELPLIGSIRGLSVNGAIDELRLEPSPDRKGKNVLLLSEVKSKSKSAQVDEEVGRHHRMQLMLYKHLLDGLLSPNMNWTALFEARKLLFRRPFKGNFRLQLKMFAKSHKLHDPSLFSWKLESMGKACGNIVSSLNLVRSRSDAKLSIIYRRPTEDVKKGKKTHDKAAPVVDAGESSVIDRREFTYDESYLQDSLDEAMNFWQGGPPERGVSAGELWKCRSCEYKDGCEWRAKKGWSDSTEVSTLQVPIAK